MKNNTHHGKTYSNRKYKHSNRRDSSHPRDDLPSHRSHRQRSQNRSHRRRSENRRSSQLKNLDYSRRVFVGGIDVEADRKDIIRYFSKFGRIIDAEIIRFKDTGNSKGYGFIFCKHKETVTKIFGRKHTLFGKVLDVNEAYDKKVVRRRNWGNDGKSRSLYITKVHNHTTQHDLREYFLQFGSVRRAYVFKKESKNGKNQWHGFVEFFSPYSLDSVFKVKSHRVKGAKVLCFRDRTCVKKNQMHEACGRKEQTFVDTEIERIRSRRRQNRDNGEHDDDDDEVYSFYSDEFGDEEEYSAGYSYSREEEYEYDDDVYYSEEEVPEYCMESEDNRTKPRKVIELQRKKRTLIPVVRNDPPVQKKNKKDSVVKEKGNNNQKNNPKTKEKGDKDEYIKKKKHTKGKKKIESVSIKEEITKKKDSQQQKNEKCEVKYLKKKQKKDLKVDPKAKVKTPIVPAVKKSSLKFEKQVEESIWRSKADFTFEFYSSCYKPEKTEKIGEKNFGLNHELNNLRLNKQTVASELWKGLMYPFKSIRNLNFGSKLVRDEAQLLAKLCSTLSDPEFIGNKKFGEDAGRINFITSRIKNSANFLNYELSKVYSMLDYIEEVIYTSGVEIVFPVQETIKEDEEKSNEEKIEGKIEKKVKGKIEKKNNKGKQLKVKNPKIKEKSVKPEVSKEKKQKKSEVTKTKNETKLKTKEVKSKKKITKKKEDHGLLRKKEGISEDSHLPLVYVKKNQSSALQEQETQLKNNKANKFVKKREKTTQRKKDEKKVKKNDDNLKKDNSKIVKPHPQPKVPELKFKVPKQPPSRVVFKYDDEPTLYVKKQPEEKRLKYEKFYERKTNTKNNSLSYREKSLQKTNKVLKSSRSLIPQGKQNDRNSKKDKDSKLDHARKPETSKHNSQEGNEFVNKSLKLVPGKPFFPPQISQPTQDASLPYSRQNEYDEYDSYEEEEYYPENNLTYEEQLELYEKNLNLLGEEEYNEIVSNQRSQLNNNKEIMEDGNFYVEEEYPEAYGNNYNKNPFPERYYEYPQAPLYSSPHPTSQPNLNSLDPKFGNIQNYSNNNNFQQKQQIYGNGGVSNNNQNDYFPDQSKPQEAYTNVMKGQEAPKNPNGTTTKASAGLGIVNQLIPDVIKNKGNKPKEYTVF